MPRPISARQRLIFNYIKQHIDSHGYPPTVREIGEAVNLSSSSTVHAHLKALEEKGMIQRDPVLTRAIKLAAESAAAATTSVKKAVEITRTAVNHSIGLGREIINVPIVGTVAAGRPLLAVEDVEDYFPLPTDFVGGDGFILRVRGESMIEDGIHDGDYVVVRRQQTAINGETVVAMIDNEATVKRFYKEKYRIRLQPANAAMDPIYAENPEILGKVVGVVRRMS